VPLPSTALRQGRSRGFTSFLSGLVRAAFLFVGCPACNESPSDMSNRFKGRREDFRFVTGAGRYTNDCNLERQAHAAFRRSERAHARIVSVDASAAREHAGVIAVFTARDVADINFITLPPIQPPPGRGGQKLLVPERPVLARDRVRFVGEEIAVVVAETTAIARDAADLIRSTTRTCRRPSVSSPRCARAHRNCTTPFRAMSTSSSNTEMRRNRSGVRARAWNGARDRREPPCRADAYGGARDARALRCGGRSLRGLVRHRAIRNSAICSRS
jgi:aldehyde oxidase/xanthine dehydrogenase-like protein